MIEALGKIMSYVGAAVLAVAGAAERLEAWLGVER